MNKPQSMSTKDWLVLQTAKQLEISEEICDTVISWAYIKAKEATLKNSHIEFSGFGKIYCSPAKIKRNLIKAERRRNNLLERTDFISEKDRTSTMEKLREVEEYISCLKSKNQ